MKFRRTRRDKWILEGVSSFELALLMALVGSDGLWEEDLVRNRLYQDPGELSEKERKEWRELTHSDLESAFHQDLETVLKDLRQAEKRVGKGTEAVYRIKSTAENAEAWYQTLNRARLALNEIHQLEAIRADSRYAEASGNQQMALLRYEIYLAIQSVLLDEFLSPRGA
ncbi:MAG: DUF2017 family protein [Verrucomicrobiota bacterium]